ncbi:helix-turn-helix domain-containing protein [Streptomyces sp. DSM 44917]|uniref:Helix-turn-helix domain-containing protein n=1 Tax=Streptomyces boetiae TaxID=3075541 RepID=A0ABU2L3U5_9ACTN|nr:helix-turn-helix domain-containing protein [Streptomyces sp. DSM 44917]MDT0306195.1 helix-turn-helix domain-containing protein [Streptomyces sp. DSM 44917]
MDSAVIAAAGAGGLGRDAFLRRSADLAAFLRQLGVSPADCVGVFMAASPDLMVSARGIRLAGAACLPLPPAHPAERLRRAMEDARARVVLADADLAPRLAGLAPPGTWVVLPPARPRVDHQPPAAEALGPTPARQAFYRQVLAFVVAHLGDPDLSPGAIARAHHVSVRTLHCLFQDHGTTVSGWIRRERLERTRRDLADPALAGLPVHRIATRYGLPHYAGFSRAFRAVYGMPPREYRRHALAGAALR